jgi:hypothetical protein
LRENGGPGRGDVAPQAACRRSLVERVAMNSTKAKTSLQDLQINCYRVWMKPKVLQKKMDRRSRLLLGQFLLGTKK